ncbi:helix-turn-helix domain-containing protein [Streptomyces sp. NPDC005776]|uniref:helix-turn-helix domain-containing protein n=1 Tax=Streptomyces sp. NPDC005776 TaxID=3154676 RepID=UPI0033C08F97
MNALDRAPLRRARHRTIFYAGGIRHVAVDRIITEAQVTRATFYRYFPSKEDLVRCSPMSSSATSRSGPR